MTSSPRAGKLSWLGHIWEGKTFGRNRLWEMPGEFYGGMSGEKRPGDYRITGRIKSLYV